MRIDLAVNPFDADVGAMVDLAVEAERAGVDGVWVADHFSAAVAGGGWSRDPFVCLGAIAAVTGRVRVGVLVANMMNRSVLQLASAVNSLQSLAPGRVVCGLGSGAVPGSRFAVEHEMIGTDLGDVESRRQGLADTLGGLRALWSGAGSYPAVGAAPAAFVDASGVLDGAPVPPIVVGGSSWATIERVVGLVDGVNLRRTTGLADVLERLDAVRPARFEVSVLTGFDDLDGDTIRAWAQRGVDRVVLGVSPPHDSGHLGRLSELRALLG